MNPWHIGRLSTPSIGPFPKKSRHALMRYHNLSPWDSEESIQESGYETAQDDGVYADGGADPIDIISDDTRIAIYRIVRAQ